MGWPLILAVLGASAAQGAYSASQSRKAQKRAREEANTRELIEGSAPNLSNVAEVIAEDVQGTDVAGLEAALAAMDYQGGEVPIPSGETLPMEDPTADLSEAELMALIEQSGIAQMASGGPVGTPEDVYYFNVPQVMEMMQDPNPQIQGVGMQLADMMTSTPGMDMVPATRDQVTMMAYGGAVTAKKYADGDQVKGTDQSLREIKGLLKNKGISEIEKLLGFRLPENFEQRDTKDILFDELMDRLDLPVDIQKEDDEYSMSKLFGDEDASLRLGASTNRGDPQIRLDFQKRFANGGSTEYDPELDADLIAQQEAFEELLELDELVEKGIISEARADYDRQRLSGLAFSQESEPRKSFPDTEKNLKGLKNFLRNKMSEGGAVTAKKFEDGGSTLLEKISGVSPDELDWAKSIDERLYPDEGLDGRGDAARHLALGSLFAKSKNPELGEALGIAREYIPFPDAGRDMDIFNNELGMTLKGTQEEIEEKIKELIEDKKAQYLTRQESYKLRGYAEGGPISEERLNQLRLR